MCASRLRRGRGRRHGRTPLASVGVSPPIFSFVLSFVIAGHSRSQNGVAKLAYARQSMQMRRLRLLPPAIHSVNSPWTTGIGVRRTPFCERLCPVVTSQRVRDSGLP